MKGKTKRIITLVICLTMLLSVPVTAHAAVTTEPESQLYHIMGYNDNYSIFTNYVDGYELYIENDMEVNTDNIGIVTVLESENKRVEIYKQSVHTTSAEGYINYSNKFLGTANTYYDVMSWTSEGIWEDSGEPRIVYYTQWSRDALSGIENDYNHYLCIDIPKDFYVYTVFIKTNYRITDPAEFEHYEAHFRTFIPSVKAPSFESEMVHPDDREWNSETREFYDTYFHEDAQLSWGIFEPEVDYTGFQNLDAYEEYFEYDFPVLLSYSEVKNTSIFTINQRLENAYERGKILELTLQTNWTPEGNMIYDILDGDYDEYLHDYAETIADFGHPVLFRLFNEMNGDWCPYSAYNYSKDTLLFREVYKYIYRIFEEEGANENTIWIWNPNEGSFPNFKWNHTLMYYPGDEYVDIIGLTAYNTGTYYAGETWKTFTELYSDMYSQYSEWFDHPFMITEFACSSTGGDKEAWMKDMFRRIRNYDNIKIAIWWDGCDWDAEGNVARSYFLDETPGTLEIFKDGIVVPWYLDVYA